MVAQSCNMLNNSKQRELDIFLIVRSKRREFRQKYNAICFKGLNSTANDLGLVVSDNLLKTHDQHILVHNLNLFINDKQFFHELLQQNENKMETLTDCRIMCKYLNAVEFILLNLAQTSKFRVKVGFIN